MASSMKADVTYVADMEIKSTNGKTRIGKDYGKWEAVLYTHIHTFTAKPSCAIDDDGKFVKEWNDRGPCKEEPSKVSKKTLSN